MTVFLVVVAPCVVAGDVSLRHVLLRRLCQFKSTVYHMSMSLLRIIYISDFLAVHCY